MPLLASFGFGLVHFLQWPERKVSVGLACLFAGFAFTLHLSLQRKCLVIVSLCVIGCGMVCVTTKLYSWKITILKSKTRDTKGQGSQAPVLAHNMR